MKANTSLVLVLVIALLAGATTSSAQYVSNVSKVGTTAANFLEIGIGAKAIGMGGAFTALADDASSTYWNPAGMAWLKNGEALFVHSNWLADINFDNVSGFTPLSNGMAVGAYITAVSMDEMKVRTVNYPEGTGELFEAGDLSFGVSYAAMVTKKLSVGVTGKYIHQKIWHSTATAMAVDLGLLFETPFDGIKLGMAVSNFGPKMQMEGRDTRVFIDPDPINPGNNDRIPANYELGEWSLPLTFRIGLAKDVVKMVNGVLTVAVDAVHPNDNYEYLNLGAQYNFRDWFFLRSGWKTLFLDDSEQGFTCGAGMRYRLNGNVALLVDAAYADFGRLENVLRYSIGVQY